MIRLVPLCMALMLIALGCRTPQTKLPTYASLDPSEAIEVLRQRSQDVRNASGEALVTLTRADGRSVRFDAALVMQPPEHVRLRAWKFGRAVFDLTVSPDGAWLSSAPGMEQVEQLQSAAASAAQFARQWSLLTGGFFEDPSLEVVFVRAKRMRLRRPGREAEPVILCDVDRETLTPRHYAILDEAGRTRFELHLDRYERIDGIVWPRRVRAISEQGRVTIEMRSVELNRELAPNAFRPPRRAEMLP